MENNKYILQLTPGGYQRIIIFLLNTKLEEKNNDRN